MKLSAKIELVFMIGAVLLIATGANAQRQMEKLGRGVVAVRTNSTTAYIGWRMLGTDPEDIGFNLYRSTTNGTPVQLTTNQTQTTDFVDTTATLSLTNSYFVRPVINGVEGVQAPPTPCRPMRPHSNTFPFRFKSRLADTTPERCTILYQHPQRLQCRGPRWRRRV